MKIPSRYLPYVIGLAKLAEWEATGHRGPAPRYVPPPTDPYDRAMHLKVLGLFKLEGLPSTRIAAAREAAAT